VVLNPVALEELHFAVVHADGEVDDELVLGLRQDDLNVGIQSDRLAGLIYLSARDFVEVWLFGERLRNGNHEGSHSITKNPEVAEGCDAARHAVRCQLQWTRRAFASSV